ncbi:GNAT family N-acetyltransferase [Streptomyces sp. NPDC091371]|uniref:GNAT family N-acetyltransferase n=1 Tax=Streptomyces sp. NPDC091371 TaxID=3155303 RepID=UPI00341451DD
MRATVRLHGSIGPAATTIAAIAQEAGVTRLTVYRHFPEEEALFAACSAHWLSGMRLPDPDAWAAIPGARPRLRAGLTDLYRFYREGEPMLTLVRRDSHALPPAQRESLAARDARYRTVLLAPFADRGTSAHHRSALIAHAAEFGTWRSLCHDHGLSEADAVEAMVSLVSRAAGPRCRELPGAPRAPRPDRATLEGGRSARYGELVGADRQAARRRVHRGVRTGHFVLSVPDTDSYADSKVVQVIGRRWDEPRVVKAARGNRGSRVFLVDDMAMQANIEGSLKQNVPCLFQEYLPSSRGRDPRVVVVDGKAVAAERPRRAWAATPKGRNSPAVPPTPWAAAWPGSTCPSPRTGISWSVRSTRAPSGPTSCRTSRRPSSTPAAPGCGTDPPWAGAPAPRPQDEQPRQDSHPMPKALPLHGHLVRLEPMTHAHAPGLLRASTEDRSTYDHTYVPADADAVDRYVERARLDAEAHLAVTYTIIRDHDGSVAGTSRLRDLEYWHAGVWPPRPGHVNPDAIPNAGQIGSTWLAPWAQRTGINTETKYLLLSLAFDQWDVHRISLHTGVRNTRSRTAIERLGAVHEGTRRAHFLAADGGVRDSALYSITRHDWPRVREQLTRRLTTAHSPTS